MNRIFLLVFLCAFANAFSQPPAYVPANGLIGYWPFDNSANDLGPQAHHGTVVGATPASDRFNLPNRAYSFNGTSNYITVPDHPALSNLSDLSISAWVKVSSLSGIQVIVAKWFVQLNCGSNSDTYEMGLLNGQVQFNTSFHNQGWGNAPFFSNNDLNTWRHLVCIYTNGQFSIYLDNVLIFNANTAASTICTTTNKLVFGADNAMATGSFQRFFGGSIDDIGMWSRGLSLCEIQQLYLSGFPALAATASGTSICVGSQATLTASGGTSYNWQPSGSGPSIIVSPQNSTTYTVTGINTSGCAASATVGVQVNAIPALTVTAPSNLPCGQPVAITASGATNYTWLPGNINGPSITVNSGVSTVFTVTGQNAGCSSTQTISLNAPPGPTLIATALPSVLCAGQSSTLSVSGAPTISWYINNQPVLSPTVAVTPSVSTAYVVTGTSASGCVSTATVAVNVNAIPVLTVTGQPNVVCGTPATLTANGAANYTWFPMNTSGSVIIVTPNVTTIYTVTGENGTCVSTRTILLQVVPGAPLNAVASPSLVCRGQVTTLSASGGPNTSWIINGLPVTSSSVVVNPLANTVYTATGINSNGCMFTATVAVNVNSAAVQVIASSTAICSGESVTVTANGATSYTWYHNLQVNSTVIQTPSATVIYTVAGNNSDCITTATVQVIVNNCTTPGFGIANAASEPAFAGASLYKINFTVIVSNLSTAALSEITLNSNLAATFPSPCSFTIITPPVVKSANSALIPDFRFDGTSNLSLIQPLSSTLLPGKKDTLIYSVLLEPNGFYGQVKNWVTGSGRPAGNGLFLTARDSSNTGFECDPDNDGNPRNNNLATLIDIDPIDFFIPQGFSPDGDGINDGFVVSGLNGRQARITIFNRWGNKVFVKEGKDLSWDGRVNVNGLVINHNLLPASTYFYVFEFLENSKKQITGFIVIQY